MAAGPWSAQFGAILYKMLTVIEFMLRGLRELISWIVRSCGVREYYCMNMYFFNDGIKDSERLFTVDQFEIRTVL